MTPALSAAEFGRLIDGLFKPTALIELAVLAACLALAWLAARLLRGSRSDRSSIWFGRHIVDGVLFPVFALLFALIGRPVLDTMLPLAVFKLVVPVLLSLLVIRLTVRVLRFALPNSSVMRATERSVSWIAWIGVVLWVTGALPLVLEELQGIEWKIGSTKVSLRSLLEGAITAIVVLVLALWASAALEVRILKGAGENLSTRKIAANVMRAVLLAIGLMFAMSAAGVDLTALGVLGGALGVGIGFGLQKLAANYVSGFVILAERSVRIGDMIKVDGFEGRVADIKTRYTLIRSLGGRESVVPNEMLISQRVENTSLADPRLWGSTTLLVPFDTDLDALMPLLVAAAAAVPRVLQDPAPGVGLSAFAADGLELTVGFWIADPQNGLGGVRSDVNLALLRTLNAQGVKIPLPQRVLHRQPAAAGPPPADQPGAA